MNYNFDEVVATKGFENKKQLAPMERFKLKDNAIMMWIAEMDFKTAPVVTKALHERVEHGIYGYPNDSHTYPKAIKDWYKTRHGMDIKTNNLNYHAGVAAGVVTIMKAFYPQGATVLIDDPVYHYFMHFLHSTGYQVLQNTLEIEGKQFERNWSLFQENLSKVDVFLLCSPHNPGGKIWSEEDLLRISTLCKQYDVLLISDEIHSDLIMPNQHFVSVGNINQDAIVVHSPSKSFNLAGMQYGFSFTGNDAYAEKIKQGMEVQFYDCNPTLSKVAMRAAFQEGGAWLDQLNVYLYENFNTMKSIFETRCPQVNIFDLQASYLTWLDVSFYESNKDVLTTLMYEEAGVVPSMGHEFGHNVDGYIRLNIASTKAKIIQASNAICDALLEHKKTSA